MANPEEALRVIRRNTESVKTLLRLKGCTEEEAEDCIQEAALKILEDLDKLDMDKNLSGFFSRITINELRKIC